jgi:hypothetical protein
MHPGRGRTACVRLFGACLASLLLYGVAFGFVVDRPLSLGFLRHQLDAKLERAASIEGPKLLILAGSNGPYSHRCEVIERVLAMPCINGGIAVGIGLDYLFARWRPLLHPGDLVYLPMEESQYVRTREATEVGPDAAIMFRHDWQTLGSLPPRRWLAALFAFDLRAALMGPIEWVLVVGNFRDPRAAATGATNAWGDHIGHTAELGATTQAVLETTVTRHPSAAQIRAGYGSVLIADFARWAGAHGIQVIGGLPTEFADAPMLDSALGAIRSVFLDNGGDFLELSNRSRYPRAAFFDTADHLSETWQIYHSLLLARQLRSRLVPQPDLSAAAAPPGQR